MKQLRIYLAFALSLTLVFTGNAMAQARTMTSPTGEIVLCTGAGPVVMAVDAEGQPTGKPHICPDCALSLLLGFSNPLATLERELAGGERLSFTHVSMPPALRKLRAPARGPPALSDV